MPTLTERMTIDRIESGRVIIDIGGELVELPLAVLPPGAAEGSVLRFVLDPHSTALLEAEARLARLRSRDTGADVIEL